MATPYIPSKSERTTLTIISGTAYIRIPANIMRSPAYEPITNYDVEIAANGTLTFTPLMLTRLSKTEKVSGTK